MASPRVFISSTCYDLSEERDGLGSFCNAFGFEATLSERGDIFYHPDLHTHASCVRETSNCHLFILIIGGRFGGKYKVDPTKSITNAEYAAAKEAGMPVFTFVKQEVLNDHNLWQRNKDQPFASQILYPSIEKQEHALEIFQFIDSVRAATVNNGLFGFRLARDIHDTLRKQWAGMVFEYLQARSVTKQISITNEAVSNLTLVSNKIEELVKNIYKNVDATNAPKTIEAIENESKAEEFFASVASRIADRKFIAEIALNSRGEKDFPPNWLEFLTEYSFFELPNEEERGEGEENDAMYLTYIMMPTFKIDGPLSKKEESEQENLRTSYAAFLALDNEAKTKVMTKYLWTKADSERANLPVEAVRIRRTRSSKPNSKK